MKFGFYTDTHLTGRNITSRLDDYSQTILGKIRQCYKYGEENNFDFMLHGGDVFNTHKISSYDLLLELRDIIDSVSFPTYFIVGNHDVYGLSFSYYNKSTLYFMSRICKNFIPIMDSIELDELVLYPCHTWNDPEYCIKQKQSINKPKVLLVHHLLDCGENSFTNLDTKNFGETDYDLILAGDLHNGFGLHSFGKTSYYNPSSLARTSRTYINNKPKMGVFTLKDKKFELEEFVIDVLNGNQIFKEELFKNINEDNYEGMNMTEESMELINNFKQIKAKSDSIFSLIDNFIQKENIPQEVINYIYTFKDKE